MLKEEANQAGAVRLPPDLAEKAMQRTHFKMRGELVDQGRIQTALASTENMNVVLKIYASGGENGMHTHPNEDHVFFVLQGSARYYDTEGGHTEVVKNEGILLPAGAYYYFHATSAEPLVLVRVGCRTGDKDIYARLNTKGEPMPTNSKENRRDATVVREGQYFE